MANAHLVTFDIRRIIAAATNSNVSHARRRQNDFRYETAQRPAGRTPPQTRRGRISEERYKRRATADESRRLARHHRPPLSSVRLR